MNALIKRKPLRRGIFDLAETAEAFRVLLNGILTVSISRFAYAIKSPAFHPRSYAHFEKVFSLDYSSSGSAKPLSLVFPCRALFA